VNPLTKIHMYVLCRSISRCFFSM